MAVALLLLDPTESCHEVALEGCVWLGLVCFGVVPCVEAGNWPLVLASTWACVSRSLGALNQYMLHVFLCLEPQSKRPRQFKWQPNHPSVVFDRVAGTPSSSTTFFGCRLSCPRCPGVGGWRQAPTQSTRVFECVLAVGALQESVNRLPGVVSSKQNCSRADEPRTHPCPLQGFVFVVVAWLQQQ